MKLLAVFGTRPEVIKLAPVIHALRELPAVFDLRLCVTAQHRDLVDPLLTLFGLTPDHDLDVMRAVQSPADVLARVLPALDALLDRDRVAWVPDWLLVQGDTTTTLAAALAGHHARVKIAHVEAGLRSGRLDQPFPEEGNRRVVGALADLHFAPTPGARDNLLREGVPADRVEVTGNTAIDALKWAARQPAPADVDRLAPASGPPMLLVTVHRREHFGAPVQEICLALRDLADARPAALRIVWPVHPNPEIDGPVRRLLAGVPNIVLVAPLEYLTFVHVTQRAHLVLTDSGGLQEEAPGLGRPVLVLRDVTERPEGLAAGVARLVGPHHARIVAEVSRLLDDPAAHRQMTAAVNPYGDGHAAARIVTALRAKTQAGHGFS